MHTIRRFFAISFLLTALLLTGVGTAGAQTDTDPTAALRFVHAIPGLQAVDVYINGSLSVKGLSYGSASGYINAPAGTQRLRVTITGLTTTLFEQTTTLPAGDSATYIAASTDDLVFVEFRDDLTPLAFGSSRLLIINAISNSQPLDIQVSGPGIDAQTIISGMGYTGSVGPSQPPANLYEISALPTAGGDPLVDLAPVSLVAGVSNMVILYGTPNAPQTLIVRAPVAGDDDSGLVRFAHGVADAPAVDITVNGTIIAARVVYGGTTPHIALPAGEHTVALQVAGSGVDVLSRSFTVEAGTAATVAALGTLDELGVEVFADDLTGINRRTALVSVINTIAESSGVTVTLADGTPLADNLPAGEQSSVVSLNPPLESAVTVDVSFGEAVASTSLPAQVFYGGVYYNAFVVSTADGAGVVFAPTQVIPFIDSAPGAVELVFATPTPEPTVTPQTEVVTAPETQPQATQPAPIIVSTAAPQFPTARVVLDPTANLQLREYPRSDALSLGLAPSGSILQVNGREGAPIDIEGNPIPNEDGTDYVDPAELLESERDDLTPSQTWLNITFATPDGGAIIAWVNAQFLDVRAPDGDPQRLADLDTIPRNRPGARQNTQITPPPVRRDFVVAEVFNLDPNVNLNIRRTPQTTGEVLARVSNGQELEFLGVGESGNWVFVGYEPPEGGRVTGWASQLYIRYTFNGAPINFEQMEARGLFLTADEETQRGVVSAGTPPLAQPTVDPLRDAFVATVVLDPTANLNLRRNPNVDAEVLARIPSGSQVVVFTRTPSGDWLEATFEGARGWIASQFVTLAFNGRPVELETIPVNTTITEPDNEQEGE